MPKSNSKPQVSKPAAVVTVLVLAAVVVLIIVGLVRVLGPGYSAYEGQCVRSNVSESDRDYDEKFIDCSDPEAAWEITKVYTTKPSNADWSSRSDARRWLERRCDTVVEDDAERRALVFDLDGDHGFLACATAVK